MERCRHVHTNDGNVINFLLATDHICIYDIILLLFYYYYKLLLPHTCVVQ